MGATLGFSPHSGWAVAIAVGGDPADPEVLFRGRIEMFDPALRGSKQPYHTIESLPLTEAEKRLAAFQKSAAARAVEGVARIVSELRVRTEPPRVAGILDASGRKGESLASILASHALIHTADGNHFRDALQAACEAAGLRVTRVRKRDLSTRASAILGISLSELEASVRALGKPLGPPWAADQKFAALLGWLLLAVT